MTNKAILLKNNLKFQSIQTDIVVIGAGAAGLFCSALLGQAGLSVTVLDKGKKPGRKILISGGGRCNFTNLYIDAQSYLSKNPHFTKSALARFTQWDFIELVSRYQIAYHEKKAGQLFCDNSAQDIVKMLLNECDLGKVNLQMRNEVTQVQQTEQGQFIIDVADKRILCNSVVVACGGLAMPGLGTTLLGYKIAEAFSIPVITTRAALVPFTLPKTLLEILKPLAGISVPVTITSESGMSFQENLLFTHRGVSGPAVLQISSYWQPGQSILIDLVAGQNIAEIIEQDRVNHPNQHIKNVLAKFLPKRLVESLMLLGLVPDLSLKQLQLVQQTQLIKKLQQWKVYPTGTEGFRTAEVTLGGVDTRALSSKTMESCQIKGLYFIGEVVDVTGWLGGYNFQWAWSSAWACAQALIAERVCAQH